MITPSPGKSSVCREHFPRADRIEFLHIGEQHDPDVLHHALILNSFARQLDTFRGPRVAHIHKEQRVHM
jgi:hypothetical protein